MITFPNEIASAAYSLASKAYGIGHAEAKEKLAAQFPQLTRNELEEIYLAACGLHETAYRVSSNLRDKKCTEAEAESLLKQKCPGFSEEVYKRAYADGMFESMW
ncbi:MAG TPA: hypothetical protein VGI88_03875 [Verrucomicrobiae bacterium]|jgi:hypothetical protein